VSAQSQSNASPSESPVREMANDAAESLAAGCRDCTEYFVTEPAKDLVSLAKDYAKEKPEVTCFWAFGIGLILGWKIKPW